MSRFSTWMRWQPWELAYLDAVWPDPDVTSGEVCSDLQRTLDAVYNQARNRRVKRSQQGRERVRVMGARLLARHEAGESYGRIGRDLGLSVGAVAGRIDRHRRAMGISVRAERLVDLDPELKVPLRHSRPVPSMPRFKCLEAADGSL